MGEYFVNNVCRTNEKCKENVKLKISKIFTKLRNIVNEREEYLLTQIDKIFEKSFFKEDLIRKGE